MSVNLREGISEGRGRGRWRRGAGVCVCVCVLPMFCRARTERAL